MKKLFATTLAGVALAATLAACGELILEFEYRRLSLIGVDRGDCAGSVEHRPDGRCRRPVQDARLARQAGGPRGRAVGARPVDGIRPTDAAFAAVPKATLAELGKNPAKLKAVLLYHVVKGDVTAAQVTKLKSAKTLEGGSVPIHVTSGKVYVGDAQVTKTNVATSNGVIHVINRVLIPAG